MPRTKNQSALATVLRLVGGAETPPSATRALELADGAVARVEDGALELRDREGRLLVRYVDGAAEIAAPSGDLVLSSPSGRVVVRSGLDFEVEAARDVVHRAGRKVGLAVGTGEPQVEVGPRQTTIAGERVAIRAEDEASVEAGTVTTLARAVATTADKIAIKTEKYELVATRLFEKSRDAFRDVVDLAQTRAGRARTLVKEIFSVNARRTVVTSEEDTSIDGRKILLG